MDRHIGLAVPAQKLTIACAVALGAVVGLGACDNEGESTPGMARIAGWYGS